MDIPIQMAMHTTCQLGYSDFPVAKRINYTCMSSQGVVEIRFNTDDDSRKLHWHSWQVETFWQTLELAIFAPSVSGDPESSTFQQVHISQEHIPITY